MSSLLISITWVMVLIAYGLFIKNYLFKERNAIIVSCVMALLFVVIAVLVKNNLVTELDDHFYDSITRIIKEPLTSVMIGITRLASNRVLLGVAFIILVIFNVTKVYYFGYMVILNLAGSYLLTRLLKYSFSRERPNFMPLIDIGGFSFPSGHSLKSISFYGLLLYYLSKHIRNPLYKKLVTFTLSLLILIIGFSRVYLGVHYISDVLAGFSVGVAWLMVLITLSKQHFKR